MCSRTPASRFGCGGGSNITLAWAASWQAEHAAATCAVPAAATTSESALRTVATPASRSFAADTHAGGRLSSSAVACTVSAAAAAFARSAWITDSCIACSAARRRCMTS